MLTDIRQAIRLLVHAPGFSAAACLTLALGIGANAAVFSVLDAALFRPLPYADPDQLVDVYEWARSAGGSEVLVYAPGSQASALRALPQVFSGVEAVQSATPRALDSGTAVSPWVGGFTPGFPKMLGITPEVGRGFETGDIERGDAILISDAYWRTALAADPNVVGRSLAFFDRQYVIVGVMPPSLRYYVGTRADAWVPISDRDGTALAGRLRTGLSLPQAQHDLAESLKSSGRTWRIDLNPAAQERVFGGSRVMLLCLSGAVAFVLLVACASVANLLLARTVERRREIRVRAALGATRLRLARQFLIEGLVLGTCGGVLAAGVAALLVHTIPVLMPPALAADLLVSALPQTDVRVFLFGALTTLVAGALCGVLPAIRASQRTFAGGLLADGSRVPTGTSGQRRVRAAVQATQVALTMILLAGAGLLVASFLKMVTEPAGFDADRLGTVSLSLPAPGFHQVDRRPETYRALAERLRAVPGVAAAAVGPSPVEGLGTQILTPGDGNAASHGAMIAPMFPVDAFYFSTAGIRLIDGRGFDAADDLPGAPLVAVVAENAARALWPGQRAVGQKVRLPSVATPLTVVGVAAHVKTLLVAKNATEIYVPIAQQPVSRGVIFRVAGAFGPAAAAVRDVVREIEPNVKIVRISPAEAVFAEFDPLAPARFSAMLLGAFTIIALATSAVGLYGLLSYSVRRRVPEIGLRMALGADTAGIRRLILADALKPVVAGVVAGLLGALWLTRFVASLLFQTAPHDPIVMTSVIGLFVVVTVIATLPPVRHATSIDPSEALRAE